MSGMALGCASTTSSARGCTTAAVRASHPCRPRRVALVCAAAKGFGPPKAEKPQVADDAASSSGAADDDLLAGKRRGRVEPKVKVDSPLVDQVTGKTPLGPEAEAEAYAIVALGLFFVLILGEGLLLAASGFMSEEVDSFVRDNLYPIYSPTVLCFLGASSLYGLWKTGKLPGQVQK